METEHTLTPTALDNEQRIDMTLRPRTLDEFVGQDRIKDNLRVFLEAARLRSDAMDHTLFCGPPGLGKTTFASIMANELKVSLKSTSGPILERAGDLAAILTNLNEYDILFIDEIHRMPRVVEEIMYPAMEDFKLDIMIGQGPGARCLKLNLPRFTLVGATTRTGLLTSPLRDRFGIINRLEYYDPSELVTIVKRSGSILKVDISEEAALEIARRSRGTPRIANRLLRRVRDFALVRNNGILDINITQYALSKLNIDERGLDDMDRKLLRTIIDKYSGGPVGLDTLSASVSEEKDTIEDVYEPYLLQEGLIERTSRGRMATRLAYEHFSILLPQRLF